MAKGGSSPDVVGAAREEAAANRETARDAAFANRPDQFNPFGALEYDTYQDTDPATGEKTTRWVQRQSLSRPMQRMFDDQMDYSQTLSGMQGNAISRAAETMSTGPDFDQFGDPIEMNYNPTQLRNRAEDAVYNKATSRLDPRFSQRQNDLEISLRNKGLRPGEEAYNREMMNYNRAKNDAYDTAQFSAVSAGRDEAGQLFNQEVKQNEIANALRDRKINEYLQKRSFDLKEAQALDPAGKVQDIAAAFNGGN